MSGSTRSLTPPQTANDAEEGENNVCVLGKITVRLSLRFEMAVLSTANVFGAEI